MAKNEATMKMNTMNIFFYLYPSFDRNQPMTLGKKPVLFSTSPRLPTEFKLIKNRIIKFYRQIRSIPYLNLRVMKQCRTDRRAVWSNFTYLQPPPLG